MKKVFKSKIFLIVITGIICISGTITATNYLYNSEQVLYNETNVKEALDDLYKNNDNMNQTSIVFGPFNSDKIIDATEIKNYQNLSVDNFVISIESFGTSLYMGDQSNRYTGGGTTNGLNAGCNVNKSTIPTKTYDKETGTLTIKNVSNSASGFSYFTNIVPGTTGYGNVYVAGNASSSISYKVYFIK